MDIDLHEKSPRRSKSKVTIFSIQSQIDWKLQQLLKKEFTIYSLLYNFLTFLGHNTRVSLAMVVLVFLAIVVQYFLDYPYLDYPYLD